MEGAGMEPDQEEDLFDEFGNLIVRDADYEVRGFSEDEQDGTDEVHGDEYNNVVDDDVDDDDEDEDAMLDQILAARDNHAQSEPNVIETDPRIRSGRGADSEMVKVPLEDQLRYVPASTVYGADVEIIVGEEDSHPLDQGILRPEEEQPEASIVPVEDNVGEGVESAHIHASTAAPEMIDSRNYLISGLLPTGKRVRSVAIVGHLHHGKTSLVDMLVQNTHRASKGTSPVAFEKFTDTRPDELERGISIRAGLITLLMTGLVASPRKYFEQHSREDRSVALQLMDSPGHPDFHDHVQTSMDLCDGVLLVVDVVEGVMCGTELAINAAVQRGLAMTLLVNKIDRLALELRIPPNDAYLKIASVIRDVNACVHSSWLKFGRRGDRSETDKTSHRALNDILFHPVRGNVCFGSTQQGWTFTLLEFAYIYTSSTTHSGSPFRLAAQLWGNVYYDPALSRFVTEQEHTGSLGLARSFVEFILNPIYKMYVVCVESSAGEEVADKLRALGGIFGDPKRLAKELQYVTKPSEMIRRVLRAFFSGNHSFRSSRGLVGMLARFIPHATSKAAHAAALCRYTGPQNGILCAQLGTACERHVSSALDTNPFIFAHVGMMVELTPGSRGGLLAAVCRVYVGILTTGMRLWALGEGFAETSSAGASEKDATPVTVQNIYVSCGKYLIKTSRAYPGQIVLLDGLEHAAEHGGTTLSSRFEISSPETSAKEPVHPFMSMTQTMHNCHATRPMMRVPLEPMRPMDLAGMVHGLRKCSLLYPALQIVVEESGEHAALGTGELYLDCVLYDMRSTFTETGFELRLSDPSVCFREGVRSESALPCCATTTNTFNRITMTAAPLAADLAEAFSSGAFGALVDSGTAGDAGPGQRERVHHQKERVQVQFGWDLLAAESLWTFGPELTQGPNCLLNEVVPGMPGSANIELLLESKGAIVQGFQWSVREGPLCDEPVHAVCMKLIDVALAPDARQRPSAQLIPASRRCAHSAMISATPCLLEPMYRVQIMCFEPALRAIKVLIARRRGQIVNQRAKAGTALHVIEAHVPVMDSIGFEVDVRSVASGQLACVQVFDHWREMRGDPFDANIVVPYSLAAASERELSKHCVIKTRRRKGLGERDMASYFEPEVWSSFLNSTDQASTINHAALLRPSSPHSPTQPIITTQTNPAELQ